MDGAAKLVTFGGYDLLTLFSDVWMFDPVSLTWSEMMSNSPSKGDGEDPQHHKNRRDTDSHFAPSPRYFHCSFEITPGVVCIVGQLLYVF